MEQLPYSTLVPGEVALCFMSCSTTELLTTLKPRSYALIYTRYVNYKMPYIYNLHPGVFLGNAKANLHMCKYTPPCKYMYSPAQTRCIFCIYVFFTYMYFWICERAANIHTYANVSFPLISSKIGSKNKIFLCLT